MKVPDHTVLDAISLMPLQHFTRSCHDDWRGPAISAAIIPRDGKLAVRPALRLVSFIAQLIMLGECYVTSFLNCAAAQLIFELLSARRWTSPVNPSFSIATRQSRAYVTSSSQ